MRLSTEEVRHIALLARVGMTDDEVELMRDHLSNILGHFDSLQELDTDGVEPTGHAADVETVMREDRVAESIDRDDALSNVPRREGDFVRVRAVLE
jgi:aspartyl-tRNA(Asn)/glutamyl-tRNA(Gln) amidotransferase subunit C